MAFIAGIKNTDGVERCCSTENESVFEAKILTDRLKDVKAGQTLDREKAISNIRKKYGV